MIYELRIYTTLPGRMPNLQARFRDHTLRIWAKHGIRQHGFWTTLVGPESNDLTYMVAWDSLADRETKWTAFQADPEWIEARADSEKTGPILSRIASSFLVPTDFSATK
jgi:hypothetical protein